MMGAARPWSSSTLSPPPIAEVRGAGYRRALVCHYMNMSSFLPWDSAEEAVRSGRVTVARADCPPRAEFVYRAAR